MRLTSLIARLLLPLFVIVLPVAFSGCGGDRYSCDSCPENDPDNPGEEGAEDPADIFPLSFIEVAEFSIVEPLTQSNLDDFDNFVDLNFRINTLTEASATEYDDKAPLANIVGIKAEHWADRTAELEWKETRSDLDDSTQRRYYLLNNDQWELRTSSNKHDLRRYDRNVYDFWLGNTVTIKWEIFEAKDRTNNGGQKYPSIAGKDIDQLANALFDPPLLADPIALESVALWGDDGRFSDEARIYVVYKQFRPITLEGNVNPAVGDFLAFVPAPANENGTAFVFRPVSPSVSPIFFVAAFTGAVPEGRFAIIEDRLYASFAPDGEPGAGGNGVMLWSRKQAEIPDGLADYDEVTVTNGSYIVIRLTPAQKIAYGLETYENPLVAFVEDEQNNGAHVGWYYVPSGKLTDDKPQPHYAFSAAAAADIKAEFRRWRRENYCDDNDHDEDPEFGTICSAMP